MNNLYVFAIGGSGERVMRSLIMLLASGVKINAKSVTPIFVDNDKNSAALTRCKNLIQYYNNSMDKGTVGIGTLCQKLPEGERPSFFQTKIEKPVLLDIAGETIGNLGEIIGKLNDNNPIEKAILEERNLLFSKDDLDMPLTVGFVGNPNIGSVVLNSLMFQNDDFTTILQSAKKGDGVIVVGSLFGGTGAAGFPLIVNSFMQNGTDRPTVGGVAVLPYFDFDAEDAYGENETVLDTNKYDVNSDSFSTKTRAALMYYDDYMSNQMDYLYYVGDDNRAHYPHYVGGKKQDNPVHLVELLSAMSIVDFAEGQNQSSIIYKEPNWGMEDDHAGNPGIANISSVIIPDIKKSLIKFQLLREYFSNESDGFLKSAIKEESPFATDLEITEDIRKACAGKKQTNPINDIEELNNIVRKEVENYNWAWGLNAFFKEWEAWFADMYNEKNRRTFRIFPYNDSSVNHANITSKFYSTGNTGIAKVETHTEGGFLGFGGHQVTAPVDPTIADYVLQAHRAKKTIKPEVEKQLPSLLRVLSNAFDAVLAQKCDL